MIISRKEKENLLFVEEVMKTEIEDKCEEIEIVSDETWIYNCEYAI